MSYNITNIEVYQGFPQDNNIDLSDDSVNEAYELLPDAYKEEWNEDNVVAFAENISSVILYDSANHATYVFNLCDLEEEARKAVERISEESDIKKLLERMTEKEVVEYLYEQRQSRELHPCGDFDNQGRWYPDEEEEECDCCESVRTPSRKWPYSKMVHCRSKKHIKNLVEKYAKKNEEK
jgi:hypothetical protein